MRQREYMLVFVARLIMSHGWQLYLPMPGIDLEARFDGVIACHELVVMWLISAESDFWLHWRH